MTPKTNREKADKVLSIRPWHSFTEAEKFILFTAAFTEAQLYPDSWERLEDLYHSVKGMEDGEECPKKGPEDESGTRHPRFMERIDWDMLRDQKKMLLTMDTYHDDLTQAEEDAITGVVHLIDAIQDYAADTMGLSNRKVFDLPG